MNLKKFKAILLPLVVFCNTAISQIGTTTVIINSNKTPGTYTARDKVQVTTGGKITPSSILKLDQNIIAPIGVNGNPYIGYSINDIYTIDKNLPVGLINGAASVNSGQASYSIPIKLPPGTSNMIPSISISYNSSTQGGLLGEGWNLACTSVITRVPKDRYHDINIEPVSLTTNDVYALDGNRFWGNNPNGSKRLENDNFSDVTINSGYSSFIVTTKDGVLMEYGVTNDSKFFVLDNSNNPVPTAYYLNKVTDKLGNYYTYHYSTQNGEIVLQEIKYTGNNASGISPYNSVKFYYQTRDDISIKYFKGNELKSQLILREIEIFCEGQSIRKYIPTYNLVAGKSYLSTITEYGLDNSHLNPTQFAYEQNSAPSSININQLPALADYKVADFNGDGKSDVLAFTYTTVFASSGQRAYTGWKLYINQNDGSSYSLVASKNGNFSPYSYYGIPNTFSPYAEGTTAINLNGDDKEDALFLNSAGGTTTYTVNLSNGNGFVEDWIFNLPTSVNIIFADIDGDKITEGIGYNSANGDIYIINFRTKKYQIKYALGAIVDNSYNTGNSGTFILNQVIDYDGDGIQELIAEINSKWRVLKIGQYNPDADQSASNFILNVLATDNMFNSATTGCYSYENHFADFNGDGLTDNLTISTIPNAQCTTSVPNNFFLRYNLGKYNSANSSFYKYPTTPMANAAPGRNDIKSKLLIADMNNDGKSDLVTITKNPTSNKVDVMVGYAPDFSNLVILGTIYGTMFPDAVNYNYYIGQQYPTNGNEIDEFCLGDFDGDGFTDIMFKNTNKDASNFNKGERTILYNGGSYTHNKLAKVTNGFSQSVKFNYKTLAKGGIYTKGSGASYPFVDIQSPIKVVSSIENQDANGNFYSIDYLYEGAKLSQYGQGFLGYDKITSTNNLSQTKTIQTNSFNSYVCNFALPSGAIQLVSAFAYRTPDNAKTYLLSNLNSPISETINTYNYVNSNGPLLPTLSVGLGHYIKLAQSISLNNVTGGNSVTDYTYDQYHNLTNSNTQSNSGQTINVTNVIDPNLYGNKYPGFIQSSTTNVTRTGKPTITKSSGFTYFPNGLLNQVTNNPSQTGCSNSTSYIYNTVGQITSTTNNSTNNTPRTTTFEYDQPKNRFVTKITNPLNHSSQAIYDSRFGVPLQTTDITNLSTTYVYDAYGRNISVTAPDNNTVSNIIKWYDSNDDISGDPFPATNILITTQTNAPNTPFNRNFYTPSGLQVKSVSEGFNQNFISNRASYNNLGQLDVAKANYLIPCANPSQVLTTTNTYNDPYFRLTSSSVTDGIAPALTTNIVYNNTAGVNKTYVTTPDGQTKITTTDGFGLTTSVYDNGGTITYDYYSDNQIKSTALNGVNTYDYTYDPCGNPLTQNEPNNGLTSFTFDGFGQLITKLNDNKTYSYVYDILGRPETFTGPEGTYAYTYITAGNGLENIETETGPDGYMNKYYYDGLNRVFKTDQTVGSTYTSMVEYDQYSNPIKYTYPSGFAIKMAYNNLGYPTTIKNDATNNLIWQADEINSFGAYNKYTLGNNIQTIDTYNNFGMLQNSTAGNVFNLSYDFNITNGNLNSLTDNIKNLQETHTYDNLDRLTNSVVMNNNTLQLGAPLTITYDAKGNITSKSDIGNYKYFSNKPNAVQKVENIGGLISTTPQNISYTAFEKALTIVEGPEQATISYGPDQERVKTDFMNINTGVSSTRYYLGDYEKEVKTGMTREVHYINAPTGLVAMHVIENGLANTYFTYNDHLGTPKTITNAGGNFVAEQNFDPWGQRRNPNTWDYNNVPAPPAWLFRGYTGHEHLPQFSLINMNGRMYDPQNARMLSADPILHDATSTQAYNKYSYCINNPLKYTDPSGYDFSFSTKNADVWIGFPFAGSSSTAQSLGNATANDVDLSMNLNGKGWSSLPQHQAVPGGGGLSAAYGSYTDQKQEKLDAIQNGELSYLSLAGSYTSKQQPKFGDATYETREYWNTMSMSDAKAMIGGGDPPGVGPYLRSLDRKLEKWGQEFFSSLKPLDQAMAKENGAAHNTLKFIQSANPMSGIINAESYAFGGTDVNGNNQTGTSVTLGLGFSAFSFGGGALNKTLANTYLKYVGQSSNFVNGSAKFTFQLGMKNYIYHSDLYSAIASRWSTSVLYNSSKTAINRLALGYPGSRNFAQQTFTGNGFGFFVTGKAARQGTTLGGGQQFYRTGLGLMINIK